MNTDETKQQNENYVSDTSTHTEKIEAIKEEIATFIEQSIINRLKNNGVINDYECSTALKELSKLAKKAS